MNDKVHLDVEAVIWNFPLDPVTLEAAISQFGMDLTAMVSVRTNPVVRSEGEAGAN